MYSFPSGLHGNTLGGVGKVIGFCRDPALKYNPKILGFSSYWLRVLRNIEVRGIIISTSESTGTSRLSWRSMGKHCQTSSLVVLMHVSFVENASARMDLARLTSDWEKVPFSWIRHWLNSTRCKRWSLDSWRSVYLSPWRTKKLKIMFTSLTNDNTSLLVRGANATSFFTNESYTEKCLKNWGSFCDTWTEKSKQTTTKWELATLGMMGRCRVPIGTLWFYGLPITSNCNSTIRYHINGNHLRHYMQTKRGWSDFTWNHIDFGLFGQQYKRLRPHHQITHMKRAHGQLPGVTGRSSNNLVTRCLRSATKHVVGRPSKAFITCPSPAPSVGNWELRGYST